MCVDVRQLKFRFETRSMSDQVVPFRSRARRKEWRVVCVVDVEPGRGLRVAAQEWLKSRKKLHKTLTASSVDKAKTMIARCKECLSCNQMFCFAWTLDGQLRVEESGACSGEKNKEVLKRHYAKAYGEQSSPARALKAMRRENIPAELLPSTVQLKNQRHSAASSRRVKGYSVECVGALEDWLHAFSRENRTYRSQLQPDLD